jgi:NAD(P)-dependent dehydrogenase (short-subunit alcohol dehydrogenase family)
MEQQVIFITGATGGLGTAMVRHFERSGAKLALHAYQQETFEAACEHAWFQADLRDESAIPALVQQVIDRFGRIDVLINNAGISRNGLSWKLSADDWNDVIAINLSAPFHLMKAVLPGMRAQQYGRIVSISSVVGQTGVPGTAAYAASKAGLIGLTKTVAKETAASGITANALALGYFDQGMISEVSPELQEQIRQQIPKQRLGSADTILAAIDWLLQPASDYVTGQTISLNGGLYTN